MECLVRVDGLDVNRACTDDGATPLYVACQNGHVEVVECLVQVGGLDVNQARTDYGATPLFVACQNGHFEVVERLVRVGGLDVNQARTWGETPLYVACQNGHLEVVERLVQVGGLDANQARTDDGATPLYVACANGHVQVVERLLQVQGLIHQARTNDGRTPLIVACENDHVEVVELCAALNARDAWQPRAMVSVLQVAVDAHALSCFHCIFTMNAEALCASTLLRDMVHTWPEPFACVVRQELVWRRRRPMLAIPRLLRMGRASSVRAGTGIKWCGSHVGCSSSSMEG